MALKIPAIPDPRGVGAGLLQDVLLALKSAVDTRLVGLHGVSEKAVLHSQLGVSITTMQVVTDVRMYSGTLQKRTRAIGLVDGIVTVIGDESDWT